MQGHKGLLHRQQHLVGTFHSTHRVLGIDTEVDPLRQGAAYRVRGHDEVAEVAHHGVIRCWIDTSQRQAQRTQRQPQRTRLEVRTIRNQCFLGEMQRALQRVRRVRIRLLAAGLCCMKLQQTAGNQQLAVQVAEAGREQFAPLQVTAQHTQCHIGADRQRGAEMVDTLVPTLAEIIGP